jgi:hypothetical protein
MYGMSDDLQLPARPGARIACDMRTAVDTPDQRLDAYRRLFADALIRRERQDGAVVLTFRASGETRARVDDLARREAACCPFVDYRVETVGEEITWTITNPVTGEDRASAEVMLDAFHELPDQVGILSPCAPRNASSTTRSPSTWPRWPSAWRSA